MANQDAWDSGLMLGQMSKYNRKRSGGGTKKPKGKPVSDVITSDGQKLTPTAPLVGSFKKGGKVKKTGIAKVHKGELVLTAKEAKSYKKSGKSSLKKNATRKRVTKKG